jgi:hypothetical protein
MSFEQASKLLNSADVIESQEILASFKAADWPNLKKSDRQKTHKDLHKMAYPFEWSNSAPLSMADAAKRLSGLAIPRGKK